MDIKKITKTLINIEKFYSYWKNGNVYFEDCKGKIVYKVEISEDLYKALKRVYLLT